MIETIVINLVRKCMAPETSHEDFVVNIALLGQLIAMAKYGGWLDVKIDGVTVAPSIRTGRQYRHLTVCK